MKIESSAIIEAIRGTRDISLPHFGNIAVREYKSGWASDAVTEIDRQVEDRLKVELAKIMPEVFFVGEEFGGDRDSEIFWLVDPIDGTGHYIRGIPFCTTMVALIKDKQVVFSAIYDFVNDVMYHAELGRGAYRDGEKISVSEQPLRGAYLSFEIKPHKEESRKLLAEVRNRALIIHTLSAGFEFVLVATGRIEGRLTYDAFGSDYDYAPGSLLVSEAGGVVRNFLRDDYDYTNPDFVASNPQVYEELVRSENGIEKLMR